MALQLTEEVIKSMADDAEDAADKVRAAGRAVAADNDLDLSGWATTWAINDVTDAWATKVSNSAGKWEAHSANLQYTGSTFVSTDEENEYRIAPQGTY